jgi:hypothetical protein
MKFVHGLVDAQPVADSGLFTVAQLATATAG